MDLIRGEVPTDLKLPREVPLEVDRHCLAKRRWRAQAADGRDFGFDLAVPLRHGQRFFVAGETAYVIAQKPEPVLALQPGQPAMAARIGWLIGNLHFPLAIGDTTIMVPDDVALRQMLTREAIPFEVTEVIFEPSHGAVASHHHA